MSWLNNSLNSIKGQLTTLAQEVLAETAGPGDDEYRGDPVVDSRTALELLADTQKANEELHQMVGEKDSEITILRKHIVELQSKFSDTGGAVAATSLATAAAPAGNSGRTSKSPSDNNATALEDSWCWELEAGKADQDPGSETSSGGNSHEMVKITLDEIALGASAKSGKKSDQSVAKQQQRIAQLEEENRQLKTSLEELDSQHDAAIQNMLELKTSLQQKLSSLSHDYETLKQENTERFISSELQLGKLQQQLQDLEQQHANTMQEKKMLEERLAADGEELRKTLSDVADLQTLLEKKSQDNSELIGRVRSANSEAERADVERAELRLKVEQLVKDVAEAQQSKAKKTSESSTSSTGKHSEDEFILVREGDATASAPATPPTKEELKDKIVQLENRVSELTLENGSFALKLQDGDMEKTLAVKVLKESLQSLQQALDEETSKLLFANESLMEEREKVQDFKDKAADAVISEEKLKVLGEEKQRIDTELGKLREQLTTQAELEKRLVLSEREKESLQLELQGLRAAQERVVELEGKVQQLTLQNQRFKLDAEAETETLNNSAELEDKLKSLRAVNDQLRLELDSLTQSKFCQAIAEERKTITDLDADDEDQPFSATKLREFVQASVDLEVNAEQQESIEQTFKALREKVNKVEILEKSIAQLSEEVIDLQDSKLVWDHEKKTLEADISQYILQCDELMKNNEILLNELENYKRNKLETISEHNEENIVQLESQLEECTELNRTLEEEYSELNGRIDELDREKQALTEQLREAQQNGATLASEQKHMRLQLETLELEKCNLLFELNELKSDNTETRSVCEATKTEALTQAEEKCQSMEKQLECLSKDHADLVDALVAQKNSLMAANKRCEESETKAATQELLLATLREELGAKEAGTVAKDEQLHKLEAAKTHLEQALLAKDNALESQQVEEAMRTALEERLSVSECEKEEQRKELQKTLEEVEKLQVQLEQLKVIAEELQNTKEALAKANDEINELRALHEAEASQADVSGDARIAQLEVELLATAELQKTVEALSYEKQEMIKALQQKHSENMQYYMEIQRLQQLSQQATTAPAPQPCEKCPALEATIAELHRDQEKQRDQINFLKEKSDILTTNLLTEQTNQKLIQTEKADVEEQNASIRKDLERLRAHLLEIEEMHTQETVEMQRDMDETREKMTTLQDAVSKSSTAYTSASIRANQHAETLQAQFALVVQQRDDLLAKLNTAEDRESKNQAALCNLQCALEQFQNGKENDIKAATQRIRKDLQLEVQKETQLQQEIAELNQQLADANDGLRAASRISDQLEASQLTVAALREEVESLKQQKLALTDQLSSSESSQTDKIEKSLIKSLLIGYVVSGHANDKQQVLRMIASVLDFSTSESDRVGLNKQQSSWLGSILGAGQATAANQGLQSRENLVQAFVQFLEQESQPQVDPQSMPNLLNHTQSAASAGAPLDGSGEHGGANTSAMATPLPIQPSLLNSNVMTEFAPTRNSSSILKDILSDS